VHRPAANEIHPRRGLQPLGRYSFKAFGHPRPRRFLRSFNHGASFWDGHPRSPDGRPVTLAEWACGEADRLDPPGMPRSRCRLRRGSSARDPCGLHGPLQRTPNASVPEQGFTGPTADPTARSARRAADPRRTTSSLLSDLVFGRHKDRFPLIQFYDLLAPFSRMFGLAPLNQSQYGKAFWTSLHVTPAFAALPGLKGSALPSVAI
jgi:hypothetical protein